LSASRNDSEQVEMVLREWLRMKEPDFRSDGVLKNVPSWDKRLIVSVFMPKHALNSVEEVTYI